MAPNTWGLQQDLTKQKVLFCSIKDHPTFFEHSDLQSQPAERAADESLMLCCQGL